MGMKALISVDYTYDFVAEKGSLTCGEPAREIEGETCGIVGKHLACGDYIVFAVDMHTREDARHPESRLFPAHNIYGTPGRKLYGGLQGIFEKNAQNKNVYWMDKTRYSAFAGTDLDLRLRAMGVSEIYVTGVCTDICVLHTMVDGYNLGYGLHVYEKAVASFNAAGHAWALQHFANCLGAEVIR